MNGAATENITSSALNLSEENWQQELQASYISDLAKGKLKIAIEASLGGDKRMRPKITSAQFDTIITRDVFFLKIGRRSFVPDFREGRLDLTRET